MIRAKELMSCLEEWRRIGNNEVEVLENPLTWKEAYKLLQPQLMELIRLKKAPPVIRFGYDPETQDIKAWIAYLATHEKIYRTNIMDVTVGGIDPLIKKAFVVTNEEGSILDVMELSPKLQSFLRGLKLVRWLI
jgi:hypothetical protein